MLDQRSRCCVSTGVDEQTPRTFERCCTVRIECECAIELLARRSPICATQVHEPERCVRLGDFIVCRQRAFRTGLRELRERCLILATEAQIGDCTRGASADEMRLMTRERFQPL